MPFCPCPHCELPGLQFDCWSWHQEAYGANAAMPVLFDASRRVRARNRRQSIRQWEWFTHAWWGWHKSCLDYMLQRCSELQLLDHIQAVGKAKQSNRGAWVYESPLIRFAKHVPEAELIDSIVESRS